MPTPSDPKPGQARITPGGRAEIGLLNAGVTQLIGLVTGGPPPHVFTTLARNRGLFRRWLWFAGGLMPGGKLPRCDTELVILRVAHNTGCDYERGHHEELGRRAGLCTAELERVGEGPDAPGWTPRQALLLGAADALHATGDIGDELWDALATEFDKPRLIELCLLIGHYEMLAMTLKALRVQPDPQPLGRRPARWRSRA